MTSAFQKQDADVSGLLGTIETHMQAMRGHIDQAHSINADVGSAYRSTASTTFQNKVGEWTDAHTQIMNKVQALHESLTTANQGFNATNDDAHQAAASLSTSITSALS